jgi:RNA polymerase sigma factor (sigma-70 family)
VEADVKDGPVSVDSDVQPVPIRAGEPPVPSKSMEPDGTDSVTTSGRKLFSKGGGFSEQRFKVIYEAVFPVLMRISYRITGDESSAEDVCQEAFIRLYEKDIPFATNDDARFWLIRVGKNLALNVAKRKGRERRAYERVLNESRFSTESTETETIKNESVREVQTALSGLPEKYRIVLILKEYANLNYAEIGRVVGISEGNVKVRVFRGREMLAKRLKEGMPNVP